jgi:hypothetical protein
MKMEQIVALTDEDCKNIINHVSLCENVGVERPTYWLQNSKIPDIIEKLEKITGLSKRTYEDMHIVKYDHIPHGEFYDAYDVHSELGKKYTEKLGQRMYTIMGMISESEIYVEFKRLNKTIFFEKGKVIVIKNTIGNTSTLEEKHLKIIANKGTPGYLFSIFVRDNINYAKDLETFYTTYQNHQRIEQTGTLTFKPTYDKYVKKVLDSLLEKRCILNPDCFAKNYNFNEYNPAVIKNVLNISHTSPSSTSSSRNSLMKKIQKYIHKSIGEHLFTFRDHQSKRYISRDDLLTRILHYEFLPLIEHVTQQKLRPSYTYLSAYVEDAVLGPHTDNPDCVYTVSFVVYKNPENLYYPIFVDTVKQKEKHKGIYPYTPDKKTCIEIDCDVGDAMVFSGTDHIHFREKLNGKYYTILLHYVP